MTLSANFGPSAGATDGACAGAGATAWFVGDVFSGAGVGFGAGSALLRAAGAGSGAFTTGAGCVRRSPGGCEAPPVGGGGLSASDGFGSDRAAAPGASPVGVPHVTHF